MLAEVLEVAVEGGDDLFEGGEAGVAAGSGQFEGAGELEGTLALLAGLPELLAEGAVLFVEGDERTDESGGREGGGGLGGGSGCGGVDGEEVGLLDGEPGEAGLEALEVFADLAYDPFGAGISRGGLGAEVEAGRDGGRAGAGCRGVGSRGERERGGGGARWFLPGRLAKWEAHGTPGLQPVSP